MLAVLCAQLTERGQARLGQIEDAAERVGEFYRLVGELQGLLARAEEGLNTQGVVGTEVEMIKQQLQEFKVGQPACFLHREDHAKAVSECACVCACMCMWLKVSSIYFGPLENVLFFSKYSCPTLMNAPQFFQLSRAHRRCVRFALEKLVFHCNAAGRKPV